MKDTTLQQRWDKLSAKKAGLISRCEQYARWTIPSLFPAASQNADSELLHTNDSIGTRCVNHLSNKVTSTLFRPNGFFRLPLNEKDKKTIQTILKDPDGAKVAEAIALVESELASVERQAMQHRDMVSYRPTATMSAKQLIVTGNALEYHPEDGRDVQVFTLRNYCVSRDLSGAVIEIMTFEEKAFETFHPDVQIQIRALNTEDKFDDDSNVKVFTRIKLEEDGKFHVTQEAGNVALDIGNVFYPPDKLRWIPLTWTLSRGEDYGRGLVEEYAATFHALEVYNQSLINLAGIMGDIKFLVNPTSVLDVARMNNSRAGTYHSGREGDVVPITIQKTQDAQFILSMIERLEKQLASAFLLNSQMIRDAERVTTEEIRLVANELETSNGGVYSRLAQQWQVPVANILLDDIGFDGTRFNIRPQVVTGMDGLTRQAEMENLGMFIRDLAMLEAVPEDVRSTINPTKYAQFCAMQRQVDYEKFLFTQEELAQRQQAAMQQQQQMMASQEQSKAAGAVATEAGKAMASDEG